MTDEETIRLECLKLAEARSTRMVKMIGGTLDNVLDPPVTRPFTLDETLQEAAVMANFVACGYQKPETKGNQDGDDG